MLCARVQPCSGSVVQKDLIGSRSPKAWEDEGRS